jgi:hypothetical protein
VDTREIENIGFVFMANETQALKMLELYDPKRTKYILVFVTLFTDGQNAQWAGYGDEGKWMWMACISGNGRDRFIPTFIEDNEMWNEKFEDVRKLFGNYTLGTHWADTNNNGQTDSGELILVDKGRNSTIYKLMSWSEHLWCTTDKSINAREEPIKPQYFKEVFVAGLNLSPDDARSNYGGLVPLVCLYEIDWQKYYSGQ